MNMRQLKRQQEINVAINIGHERGFRAGVDHEKKAQTEQLRLQRQRTELEALKAMSNMMEQMSHAANGMTKLWMSVNGQL